LVVDVVLEEADDTERARDQADGVQEALSAHDDGKLEIVVVL